MNADEMVLSALCSLLECIQRLTSVCLVLHTQYQVGTRFNTMEAASLRCNPIACVSEKYASVHRMQGACKVRSSMSFVRYWIGIGLQQTLQVLIIQLPESGLTLHQ